jgi:type IV pilus assembly protein PilE
MKSGFNSGSRAARGFSLIEIMVVVGIVGILAAIAYPSYINYTLRSHRTDAMRTLTSLAQSLERCYSQNFSYSACPAVPNASTTATPNGYYSVSATVASGAYTLTASAQGYQLKDTSCATMGIDSVAGQQATNTGGTNTAVTCWGSN